MLQSQRLISGGRGIGDQLPTFDAESKNAKIPKSHFQGVGGGDQLAKFKTSEPKA